MSGWPPIIIFIHARKNVKRNIEIEIQWHMKSRKKKKQKKKKRKKDKKWKMINKLGI